MSFPRMPLTPPSRALPDCSPWAQHPSLGASVKGLLSGSTRKSTCRRAWKVSRVERSELVHRSATSVFVPWCGHLASICRIHNWQCLFVFPLGIGTSWVVQSCSLLLDSICLQSILTNSRHFSGALHFQSRHQWQKSHCVTQFSLN